MSDNEIKFPKDHVKPIDPASVKIKTKVVQFPKTLEMVSEKPPNISIKNLVSGLAELYQRLEGLALNGTDPNITEMDLLLLHETVHILLNTRMVTE